MKEHVISIGPDGSLNFVDDPALAGLKADGVVTVRRASHVLPVNRLLRVVFRFLRDHFGETGVIAGFTRRWPCVWQADLAPSGGPVLGPFRVRADAIAAEVAWLNAHI